MWIKKLKLKNFRNYENEEMIFEKGINYLFGSNGVGKTNIMEAIYYIANLGSFRTNDDKLMIKEYKGQFEIEAVIDELEYKLLVNRDNKVLIIDGIIYKKYRDYIGHCNVVEFSPDDVYLLKDYPKERRKFVDKEISKIDKDYLNDMLIYNKLLKQRNELLKKEDLYKEDLLLVIDERLADLQVRIITKRKEFLHQLKESINRFKTSLNDKYKFDIKYICGFKEVDKMSILEEYKNNFVKDKEKLSTGCGVHKDDFKIYINGYDASGFGSQGEQRFIVLLMKLALCELIENKIKEYPIVVLDDVFSELDEKKKKEIYDILKKFQQVFITGCIEEDLKEVTTYTKYEIINNKVMKKEEKINE